MGVSTFLHDCDFFTNAVHRTVREWIGLIPSRWILLVDLSQHLDFVALYINLSDTFDGLKVHGVRSVERENNGLTMVYPLMSGFRSLQM